MIISKEDANGRIDIGVSNMEFFVIGADDPCFSFSHTVVLKKPIDRINTQNKMLCRRPNTP